MTSKALLLKRLEVALGQTIPKATFTWFFGYFCERTRQKRSVRTAKELPEEQVWAFSEFCGYDLRFPIPLPLLTQK